jgi:signal transduction histidine kinase
MALHAAFQSPAVQGLQRIFWRSILRSRPLAYVLAILVTLVTVLFRHAFDSVWGTKMPFMLFFPAIMVVGRLGGLGPGVLSTVLSTLAIDYYWIEPVGTLHLPTPKNVPSFVVFVASGLLISALNGSLHAAMRRTDRLRDARETLLSIVAHDLRNPLGSISMSAGSLRRKGHDPEASAQALDMIERCVGRMDRLIADVLDATKLESGGVAVVLREELVAPLALEVVEAFIPSARANRIELVSSVPPDLPPIRCDRDRVVQILGNLLGNALKFTPGGGRIALAATHTGPFVQLKVSDSGPGIAPRDLAHVFERYWRKGGSGAGLGLFIVHGLVAAQGGRAWVESEPGRGASVFVALPIVK